MKRCLVTAALVCMTAAGCAGTRQGTAVSRAPTQPTRPQEKTSPSARPADADAVAQYYRERAAAIGSEVPDEIERTDFARFRRGRLYAGGASQEVAQSLGQQLSEAFDKGASSTVVEITTKMLADDQTDIRAHMLRAIGLRKLERAKEADFHRAVALTLIKSIMKSGDGRVARSAWTVFQVKEEYEVIKVLGGIVESQSLTTEGGKTFDILEARPVRGGGSMRVYFDITELFAENARNLGAS